MTTPDLIAQLKFDEGEPGTHEPLLHACPDPVSHGEPWTIGWGHTGKEVHPGLCWTLDQCQMALEADIGATEHQLDHFLPWWRHLDDVRQDALVNMAFNVGIGTLLTFRQMLASLEKQDWVHASAQMLLSKWASQVGERAERLANMIRTGQRSAGAVA